MNLKSIKNQAEDKVKSELKLNELQELISQFRAHGTAAFDELPPNLDGRPLPHLGEMIKLIDELEADLGQLREAIQQTIDSR